MAAGAWKIFTRAKRLIGTGGAAMTSGGVTLGAGIFKMTLHRASASANLLKITNTGISTYASVTGEISQRGGYTTGGKALSPNAGKWTVGSSTKAIKFTMTTAGLVFSAASSALNNIKYAVIRTSSGAGAGKVVCFCTLSTAAFNVTSGNTMTIAPATNGFFQMA